MENAGDKENERTVMKFHPSLAPIKAAILPLMKKPELEEVANKILFDLSMKLYPIFCNQSWGKAFSK